MRPGMWKVTSKYHTGFAGQAADTNIHELTQRPDRTLRENKELVNCLKIVMISLNFVIKILPGKVPLHLEIITQLKRCKRIQLYWFLFFYCLLISLFRKRQTAQKVSAYFSGAVSVTNNGISIVPSFSLDKPAVIFNLSMGKNRFSFEPDIRFSLAGKPWSFLFWGRYKLVTNDKFKMNAGAHLGLNFRTSVLPINGDSSTELTVARRYLARRIVSQVFHLQKISVLVSITCIHMVLMQAP